MTDEPREIVQAIIDRIDQSWDKDGFVPGEVLTEDAVYTNVSGVFSRGRAAIIADTAKTKARFNTTVARRDIIEVKKVAETVILALVVSTARRPQGAEYEEFRGMQLYVIVWDTDAWRIAAYQNTRLPAGTTPT